MGCRFFEEGRLCACRAVRGLVVPSHHERERFCHSGDEARCPTHRLRLLRGEALPEEVYYALWLPVAPTDADAGEPAAVPPLPARP